MNGKVKFIINPGDKFGQLEIIEQAPRSINRDIMFSCKCSCGTVKNIAKTSLVSGATTSCGCYRKKRQVESNCQHGMSKTLIYQVWNSMIQRCDNKNNNRYHNYGGRGITYCKEFRTFEGFYAVMGSDYKIGLTLDRIDVDKNYTPDNCRWVTWEVQANNKSNNRMVVDPKNNETITLAQLSKRYSIPVITLFGRLSRGDTGDRLVRPPRKLKKDNSK